MKRRKESPPGATTPAPAAPVVAAPTAQAAQDRITALSEAMENELERLHAEIRAEMRAGDADLVHALEHVAESYDRVAARLDDERRVQALLAEALVRLDRRLAKIEQGRGARNGTSTGPRVIGGSITPPAPRPPRLES